MDDRCVLSDLPADQCACRIHKPEPRRSVADSDGYIVARTEALYPGRCLACDSRYSRTDPIALHSEHGWIHEECI